MSVLSLGKKRQLNKEKKLSEYREDLSKQTGILFSSELVSDDKRFPLIKYVVNSLILFAITFGTLDCFVTAFEFDLTVLPMIVTCIVFSIVFSFMYISNKAKVITYLAVFFGIVFSGTRFFTIINSGVSAIVNNMLIYIDDKSGLPFIREYNVFYKDEYVAMSVALCVMAVALMLIINIFISERMSFVMLFVITFPIVQLGMFFGYNSSKIAMFCVASGWILVAAIKLTNAYNGLTDEMVSRSSINKHRHRYGFITDSRNVALIAVVWLTFAAGVTGLVFSVVPTENFTVSLPTNAVRQAIERPVKNFLSYGFSSMFSRETTADGVGKLSNQSQVSYDGRVDLEVYLVNYRVNRIYLRSFAGYRYLSDKLRWVQPVQISEVIDSKASKNMLLASASVLENDYNTSQKVCKSWHRMGIKIKDSSLLYQPVLTPYFAYSEDESNILYRSSGQIEYNNISTKTSSDVDYYTFYTVDDDSEISTLNSEANGEFLENARKEAYSFGLDVPDRNIKAISDFCKEFNINKGDKDTVSKVINALENNFTYTLKPGKIPYGEDYINYFLAGSRKGYCQHFASAAVMIFRYLGIPSRYAEGYVIDREDFISADYLDDEEADDWIKTPYKNAGAVQTVEITDASAHAWVEVYTDGIGWTVVEATTAAAEEEKSLLSTIFGRNSILGSAQENLINGVRKIDAERTKHNIGLLMLLILSLSVMAYITRMMYIIIRRHKSFSTSDSRINLSRRYAHTYETWKYSEGSENESVSYTEFAEIMSTSGCFDKPDNDFCNRLERSLFGKETNGESEYKQLEKTLAEYRRFVVRNMRPVKKFRYFFINIRW